MRKIKLTVPAMLLSMFTASAQTYVWTQKASLPSSPRMGAAGFSIGNYGYAACGLTAAGPVNELWKYDETLNAWTQQAGLPGLPRYNASAFAINGKGYVCLGWGNTSGNLQLKDLWEYNPATNSWTAKNDFPGGPRYTASAFVIGNAAYAGLGYAPLYNDFYRYEPLFDAWTQVASFPGGVRQSCGAFAVDSLGFITCGSPNFTAYYKDLWQYSPATNQWTQKSSLPSSERFSPAVFTIGKMAFCGLGVINVNPVYFFDFYKYDYLSDTWSFQSMFPGTERSNAVTFSIGKTGFVAFGKTGTNTFLNDCWALTDVTPVDETTRQQIAIYPNPCNDYLNIAATFQNLQQVFIRDLNGFLIQKFELNKQAEINAVPVSFLPAGSYLLQVVTHNKMITRSFTVMH
jgi:N-acetylneuraminic acid mutarotase